MNFQDIYSKEAQKFITENKGAVVEELLLKAKKFPSLNIPLLVAQIEGRVKAKQKLPTFFANEKIIFPVKLSMEQCSSEATAKYKASLVSGKTLMDLTGGFGIDSLAFSATMEKVIYIDRNKELAAIVAHNFTILNKTSIEIVSSNSETYLENYQGNVDWIYLDPARRKEGGKVVKLTDCEPNVLSIKGLLFSKSTRLLLKTSPLLDIDLATKELEYVTEVHVVSVENDCKELLFVLDKHAESKDPKMVAINFLKNEAKQFFQTTRKAEQLVEVAFSKPLRYLYEPNSAVMKAGLFKSIGKSYSLAKLHSNSHLYTSDKFYVDFPGRVFEVDAVLKYSKKEVTHHLVDGKANVVSRNFPDNPDAIKKKLGVKDGGDVYLFATTNLNQKLVILLTKKRN